MSSLELALQASQGVAAVAALTPVECQQLWRCAQAVPSGGTVVEVGCQGGRSSSILTAGAMANNYRIIHIDPYAHEPGYLTVWRETLLKLAGPDYPLCLLAMRTEFADPWLDLLCPRGIDLAFIDGDHAEQPVRTDLAVVASRLRPGGVLCGHDWHPDLFPGVGIAVTDYCNQGQWTGIERYDSFYRSVRVA